MEVKSLSSPFLFVVSDEDEEREREERGKMTRRGRGRGSLRRQCSSLACSARRQLSIHSVSDDCYCQHIPCPSLNIYWNIREREKKNTVSEKGEVLYTQSIGVNIRQKQQQLWFLLEPIVVVHCRDIASPQAL